VCIFWGSADTITEFKQTSHLDLYGYQPRCPSFSATQNAVTGVGEQDKLEDLRASSMAQRNIAKLLPKFLADRARISTKRWQKKSSDSVPR
jgi:hypothetical protein